MMDPTVLAVNAGSGTVKTALFSFEAAPRELRRDSTAGDPATTVRDTVDRTAAIAADRPLAAIGHRIVHGGTTYQAPLRITPEVIEGLRRAIPFAPNHLPGAIALIEALTASHPDVPQIACFDTAFHRDLPEVARRLPIPAEYDARGVRRYGFHGLSYSYILQELARAGGPPAAAGRLIIAHLGNGSSLAAVHDGRSIDTSMGLTPIGGVVMSTRSGDLDPGVVAFIARAERLTGDEIEDLFSHHAGLKAVSGSTGDMRELLTRDDAPSRLAVAMYVYQVRRWIGAFAAALGGLDGLVFTGGIGEHAHEIRRSICVGLEFLGIDLDEGRNAHSETVISSASARVPVRVIATNEELMIAQAAFTVLNGGT
jgi:acetate kinase